MKSHEIFKTYVTFNYSHLHYHLRHYLLIRRGKHHVRAHTQTDGGAFRGSMSCLRLPRGRETAGA